MDLGYSDVVLVLYVFGPTTPQLKGGRKLPLVAGYGDTSILSPFGLELVPTANSSGSCPTDVPFLCLFYINVAGWMVESLVIRQPHCPQLIATMLSTGPGLAVSPPWRLVDITVAHIFLPSSAFYVHIDSPLFMAFWDTGALEPDFQILLYFAQTAGGHLITSFLLHWPEH
jgi:hypothetical protein